VGKAKATAAQDVARASERFEKLKLEMKLRDKQDKENKELLELQLRDKKDKENKEKEKSESMSTNVPPTATTPAQAALGADAAGAPLQPPTQQPTPVGAAADLDDQAVPNLLRAVALVMEMMKRKSSEQ